MASNTFCGNQLSVSVKHQKSRGKPPFVISISKQGRVVDRLGLSIKDAKRLWKAFDAELPRHPEFWAPRTD